MLLYSILAKNTDQIKLFLNSYKKRIMLRIVFQKRMQALRYQTYILSKQVCYQMSAMSAPLPCFMIRLYRLSRTAVTVRLTISNLLKIGNICHRYPRSVISNPFAMKFNIKFNHISSTREVVTKRRVFLNVSKYFQTRTRLIFRIGDVMCARQKRLKTE